MEIECIGVGEASDPIHGNASVLIRSETKLLVDCGYATPALFLLSQPGPDDLDAIYFTHFHADHIFGLPGLIVTWYAQKREKPLTILGQPGVKERVQHLIELAYPGILTRMPFRIDYIETTEPCQLNELELAFALTEHPLPNYAIRITVGGISVGVSGDGAMTPASMALFKPCSIVIHEAYCLDEKVGGHTSAAEVIEAASKFPKLKILALTHLRKDERQSKRDQFLALGSRRKFRVTVPDAGEQYYS